MVWGPSLRRVRLFLGGASWLGLGPLLHVDHTCSYDRPDDDGRSAVAIALAGGHATHPPRWAHDTDAVMPGLRRYQVSPSSIASCASSSLSNSSASIMTPEHRARCDKQQPSRDFLGITNSQSNWHCYY